MTRTSCSQRRGLALALAGRPGRAHRRVSKTVRRRPFHDAAKPDPQHPNFHSRTAADLSRFGSHTAGKRLLRSRHVGAQVAANAFGITS